MTGEEFLRGLADRLVAEVDVAGWWSRFSEAFGALDVAGEIDVDEARRIGQGIRAALAERTGQPVPDFWLAGRRTAADPPPVRPPLPDRDVAGLAVRAAWAPIPAAMGSGAVDFVSVTATDCWLVLSGAGPAPWPQPDRPGPALAARGGARPLKRPRVASPDQAMFVSVGDDGGGRYLLRPSSHSSSDSGGKRRRWDLRLELEPPPGPDVDRLRFETPVGPLDVPLSPACDADVGPGPSRPALSQVEFHLARRLHFHAWRHLLDPERPPSRMDGVAEALTAVGALGEGHPLIAAARAVDAAIAGDREAAAALPGDLAAALAPRDGSSAPWVGCRAVGVVVDHPDTGPFGVEALVGHPDRLALHFIQSARRAGAWGLVATARDDRDRGYVAHAESLSSPAEGALHFRPPLPLDASALTVSLAGPAATVTVTASVGR